MTRQLAVNQALNQVGKERDTLINQLAQAKQENDDVANLAKADIAK